MESNKYVNVTLGITQACVAASFFLGKEVIMLWIAGGLTGVNIILLLLRLFRGEAITPWVMLLGLAQIILFCQLHALIYNILGPENYVWGSSGVPSFNAWMKFTGGHVLKAADILDIIGAYGISLQLPECQGTPATAALFAMYLLVSLFTAGLFFRLAGIVAPEKPLDREPDIREKIVKWGRLVGLIAAIILIGVFGWKSKWETSMWYLWPGDNILRTLDLPDAIQIFGWQDHPLNMATGLASAAIFFRLIIASYAMVMVTYLGKSLFRERGKSVEELAQIFSSPEYSTKERIDAIKNLEYWGEFAKSVIPDLVKILISGNSFIRGASAKALANIDSRWYKSDTVRKALPGLIKAMENENRGVRLAAAESLGEIGPGAVKAIPRLIKAMENDALTNAAARSLGKIGPEAIPHLVKMLAHKDDNIRSAAVGALRTIDPMWTENEAARKGITLFVKSLDSDDAQAHRRAVRVLGEIGSAAIPQLARLLTDNFARDLAMKALAEIGPQAEKEAAPHLIEMLADGNEKIRHAAAEALESIHPNWQKGDLARNAASRFAETLTNNRGEYAAGPAEALAEIGHFSVHPLAEALVHNKEEVRKAAARSLEKIDPEWVKNKEANKAVPFLTKALESPKWYIRCVAAEILGNMGPAALKAVPFLVKGLTDSNKEARKAIKEALDKVVVHNPAIAAKSVKEVSEDEMKASSEKNRKEDIVGLVKKLAHTDAEVRAEAVRELKKTDTKWQENEIIRAEIPNLVKSMTDSSFESGYAAPAEALMEIGTGSVQCLVEKLTDSNKGIANTAKSLLKRIEPQWPESQGARDAVPNVAKALEHSEWFVRKAAAEVLGRIGPDAIRAMPFLVKALADPNKDVRIAAKKTMDKIVLKK